MQNIVECNTSGGSPEMLALVHSYHCHLTIISSNYFQEEASTLSLNSFAVFFMKVLITDQHIPSAMFPLYRVDNTPDNGCLTLCSQFTSLLPEDKLDIYSHTTSLRLGLRGLFYQHSAVRPCHDYSIIINILCR